MKQRLPIRLCPYTGGLSGRWVGEAVDLQGELVAQAVMLRPELRVRGSPRLWWVEADRTSSMLVRFPVVAEPDVSVQDGVPVAVDLVVDSVERGVAFAADDVDGFAE